MLRALLPLGLLLFAVAHAGCASPRLSHDLPVSGSGSDDGAPAVGSVPLAGRVPDAPPLGYGEPASAGDPLTQELGRADFDVVLDKTSAYPREGRVVGSPGDINVDLATAFPRRNALLPQVLPDGLFRWKKRLYDCTGIRLAFSYMALAQHYSDTLPIAEDDVGAGGWMLLEAKWDAVNRGGDYAGSLEAAVDWRHSLFDKPTPTEMSVLAGSGWSAGALYTEWDPSVTALFWQQWLGKDTFEFRVGKQTAPTIFDFFRFKDARVSSMGDIANADLASIPTPPPGYGLSFKWWPVKRGSLRALYVVGTVNDMNGEPEELSPKSLEHGQFFYGLEVGYNWKRKFPLDFDHAHLSVWYADERTDAYDAPPIIPNGAGWGFKLGGEKQCGRLVGFGKYAYNNAEGGGVGLTWAEQSATVGAAVLKPFDVKGEIGVSASWMHPLFDIMRDQYGADLYWRVLLTPNLWVTPGVQLIWDPALNPTVDFLAVPGLKLRWFF